MTAEVSAFKVKNMGVFRKAVSLLFVSVASIVFLGDVVASNETSCNKSLRSLIALIRSSPELEHDLLLTRWRRESPLFRDNLREILPIGSDLESLEAQLLSFESNSSFQRVYPERFRRAVQVMKRRAAHGVHFPDLVIEDRDLRHIFAEEQNQIILPRWRTWIQSRLPSMSVYHNVPLARIDSGQLSRVYLVEIPNGAKVFRSAVENTSGEYAKNNIGAARKGMAAFLLNRALGLHTVPTQEFALVNSMIGVLSERLPENFGRLGEPDSVIEVTFFESLINNRDLHSGNFRVLDGRIKVFDHDLAFGFGLDPGNTAVFSDLPRAFPSYLRNRLKSLTPERIRDLVDPYLTEAEIQTLLLGGKCYWRIPIWEDCGMYFAQALPERVSAR